GAGGSRSERVAHHEVLGEAGRLARGGLRGHGNHCVFTPPAQAIQRTVRQPLGFPVRWFKIVADS
ncbi:hypothetical protein, partial [Stenotrophomonas maltophilia]|uniref:hypothetical protein n=1 Tax=Stenotrophomonas maltophilia TaxID=40324 RepID=UPI001A7E0E01